MKKFLYFTLLCVAVCATWWVLQKNKHMDIVSESQEKTYTISSGNMRDCQCQSECLCPQNDHDCDCSQTKSVCTCINAEGKSVTIESIEDNNSDIEELYPDKTFNEDETILAE